MARTKNTQPTPHHGEPPSQTPNFILLGPPQPICEAKPLQSRPARVKHVAHRRILGKMTDSASKTIPNPNQEPSTNLEECRNISIGKTEHVKASEKGASASTTPKPSGRKPPTRSSAKRSNVVDKPSIDPKPSRKRKSTEMSNWNRKSIVVGTTYLPEEIEGLGWNILPFLNYQAWEEVVALDDLVYEEKIREFYSKASFTMEPLEVTSSIGDMEFTINADIIGKALAIPNKGTEIFEEGWNNALGISGKELRRILVTDPSLPIEASNLKPIVRIFHHMSTHTLLPRAGTHDKVSFGDQIILYHLMEKKPLNLPFLILNHIISAIKAEKS